MVEAVRQGSSQRATAREFGVSLSTVQAWLQRAAKQRLDRTSWADLPSVPLHTRRTESTIEDLVLALRLELRDRSVLGECGATAIRAALVERARSAPSVRTIGRILERRGALDGQLRVRRPAPQRGWYLPEVAKGHAELDSFDAVTGLVIKGGSDVEVLNAVSLHGGLVGSWPLGVVTAKATVDALVEHWHSVGLPAFAQFDNDTRFQGAHQFADSIGRVIRLCISLGVVPVFAPPRETGFQAAIESFNGLWQAKVWARFHHASLPELQERSSRYVQAHRERCRVRIEAAPPRRPFPKRFRLDLQQHPRGRLVFLRRTDESGHASVLGHTFEVHPQWQHRLVRAEIELDRESLRFFALRRSAPALQPQLAEVAYRLPVRRFKE